MTPRLLAVLAIVSLIASACGHTPTDTSRTPERAAFDGGLGMGSGNRADSTTAPTNDTASGARETVPGGLGMGSGN